jgi:glycosyltransferase involved in cell wall biosynthesis
MRILIATCNRSIIGGVERYLKTLIPALLERGHRVAILYEHSSAAGATPVDPPNAGMPIWFWEDLRLNPALWQELSTWKPEVVYSHSSQSLEMESALLSSYPTVLYAHVYLGTCITGRKSHAFPQIQPCDRHFGPMCLVMHYPCRCGGLNPLRMWQMYRSQRLRNSRLSDYRAILVASKHMYREFEEHGVSRDRLRLVALPMTDTMTQIFPPAPRLPDGKIVFVGRLTDLKGADYLMKAIPKAAEQLGRPLTLTIAGDGPQRATLQDLADKLGVTVHFTGWIGSEQKLDVMRQADLLAVPSLWPEPFGLVGIEAGHLGTPAVGYAVGGIRDWLIAGKTGELAPGDPPTVQGLADAIVRAVGDPGHYAALCRGAWELASRFTLSAHVIMLEEILSANTNVVSWTSAAFSSTVPH